MLFHFIFNLRFSMKANSHILLPLLLFFIFFPLLSPNTTTQEVGAAGKKTSEAVDAADRIMEAISIADAEPEEGECDKMCQSFPSFSFFCFLASN